MLKRFDYDLADRLTESRWTTYNVRSVTSSNEFQMYDYDSHGKPHSTTITYQ